MAEPNTSGIHGDPFELNRFVEAQEDIYASALAQIRAGQKRSHWMWYIFPQIEGLGFSSTSRRYAIRGIAEATSYLAHPIVGPRLLECSKAALNVERRSAHEVFGSPDDLKLQSCATLFAQVSPPASVFEQLIDRFFEGQPDQNTLRQLRGPTSES